MDISQKFDVPTVDVNNQVLLQIYKLRPDIERLYCTNFKPNGVQWCPGWPNTQPGNDLAIQIVKDWWINAAGLPDDTPSLYGNSLAEWARQVLGLNPSSTSATTDSTSKTFSITDEQGNLTGIAWLSAALVVGMLFFIGDKKKRLLSVPSSKYFAAIEDVEKGKKGK